MSEEYKAMIEKTLWTFVQAFLGVLTVGPLVNVNAELWQLAAMSGASAAMVVIKEFAKKQLAPKPIKSSK
jgi:hypothetical protein